MRHTYALAAACVISLAGCQNGIGGDAVLESQDQKASYAVGLEFGSQLAVAGDHIDMPAFLAGVEDARAGKESRLTDEEVQIAMQGLSEALQAEQAVEREAQATENEAAGAAYLAENGAREGVMTTDSGLQYEVLREGDGAQPAREDNVTIHYRGSLVDGTEFDASYGGDPLTLGAGDFIPGFTEALLLMSVGDHFRVAIPGEIAYGLRGSPPLIGPNATLIFDIELLEIAQ